MREGEETSLDIDSLKADKASLVNEIVAKKAKLRALEQKRYALRTQQDIELINAFHEEVVQLGSQIRNIDIALISAKNQQREHKLKQDRARECLFVDECRKVLPGTLFAQILSSVNAQLDGLPGFLVELPSSLSGPDYPAMFEELSRQLSDARAALASHKGSEVAVEFVAVARVALAEHTYGKLHARAVDQARQKARRHERE